MVGFIRNERCRVAIQLISFLLLPLVLFSCSSKKSETKTLVIINGKAISQESYDAFSKMLSIYPTQKDVIFPGDRNNMTVLVETELLYSKASFGISKQAVKTSPDWIWKKRFFCSERFFEKVINANLGLSDADIESYYETNKDSFVVHQADTDSLKKPKISYRPLAEVRNSIVEKLFLKTYPPESTFVAFFSKDSSLISNPALLNQRWVSNVRRNPADFFMKKLYNKKYGSAFPDSFTTWFNQKGIIKPSDIDLIFTWIPKQQRGNFSTRRDTANLAQFLLQWKLFSEKALEPTFKSMVDIDQLLDWGWKFQVANALMQKNIAKIKPSIRLDSTMCKYAAWDTYGVFSGMEKAPIDWAFEKYTNRRLTEETNSIIYKYRKRSSVKYMQSDWQDEMVESPIRLAAEADSLIAANNSSQALGKYNTLRMTFGSTPEGKRALIELAKIATDEGNYAQALMHYRDYLVLGNTTEDRCKIFFMIGFLSDEHLDKPENAEVNYKWILKNTPDCELADDAEFMCQHLDEEMVNIDELQAEAARQGHTSANESSAQVSDSLLDK